MPKKKTNEQFLLEIKSLVGDEFTPLETYKGSNVKINFRHSVCNNVIGVRPKDFIYKGVRCTVCAGNKQPTIDEVKDFIESQSNCKLLSNSYQNQNTLLDILCPCGNVYQTKFAYFKHENKRQCNDCGLEIIKSKRRLTYEFVKDKIADKGHTLLSSIYLNNTAPLEIECPYGHIYTQTYNDFNAGHMCKTCSYEHTASKHRHDVSFIKDYLRQFNYEIISDNYINNRLKLGIKCPLNHDFKMAFKDFSSGQRCPQCYSMNRRENATSHIFAYLRNYIDDWKRSSMKNCNYKCVLTGGKFDAVHHLYSFNLIAKESFLNTNLDIRPEVSQYSDDELKVLISEIQSLHVKYGRGVCLRKDVHSLYHSIYGFVNNSEQFEEFKSRWFSGEFKEVN